ncbi:MAG TPA: N-acetylmuramoyl-L-alanine amidase [Terriglobales bacterium]|nr:N-acetylmuramoyl-L-alanine amidase [Terriglobales bacterium]
MATSFPLTSGRAQMRHLAVACRQIRQAAGFGEITSLLQQLLGAAALISILTISLNAASGSVASRKLEAREQFDKAEQMREALNGRPADQRTRKDYQHVADAYRKVYYVAPMSSKADASVVAVAEIFAEMGRQFQPGEKDLRAAISQYEFLRREYPGSKYRFQALFTIGQIYKEDLGDEDAARETFHEFLKHYPRNSLAPQAKQALAELDQPAPAPKPAEEAHAPEKAETPSAQVPVSAPVKKKSALELVTGIRHWSSPDYTRVAIDVDGEVKYEAGRVPHPDRIFFDLHDTRLASVLVGKSFEVQDGFLKKIRVAQYQPDSTRVVLEVADVSDYSAFLLPNPYRLIIDIHGRQTQSQTLIAKANATAGAKPEGTVTAVEKERSYRSVEKANEAETPSQGAVAAPPSSKAAAASTKPANEPSASDARSAAQPARSTTPAGPPAQPVPHKVVVDDNDDDTESATSSTTAASAKPNDPLFAGPKDTSGPELKATDQPTTSPTAVAVAPRAKDSKKDSKKSKTAASNAPAGHEAAPTSTGDRSLTRTLGLKIGRIVVDAGHGGHDTGTIGPEGLMEKDLVLDVALRLGRLLETHLGADVIFTRDDDTFIPLETRTAVANEHQADLFISIHANSSSDPAARGVETYYLNFTSNPAALEVAARENAVSEKSIFELQDLVKKITLKDKIEESRELATDVQESLYAGLATRRSTLKDRGVKKAPFVVLIGANMPSILAEISFVSNPTDEAKLETPEYREKIAESLYKGIAKYAGGLSGVKVATKFHKDASQ